MYNPYCSECEANGTDVKHMNTKSTQIAARVSEAEREELKNVAERLDIPEAQIIREAVREKLEQLQLTHPELADVEVV